MRLVRLAFAVVAVGSGACIGVGVFECDSNDACGPDGVCEPDGYCSSPDGGCDGGRRYSRYAPEGIAGTCVAVGGGSTSVADGTTSGPGDGTSSGDDGSSGAVDDGSGSGSTGEPPSECLPPGRIANEPVLLYDFCEGEGPTVRSVTDTPMPLTWQDSAMMGSYTWLDEGLELISSVQDSYAVVRADEVLLDTFEECWDSGEVTVEAWVTPNPLHTPGPDVVIGVGNPLADGINFGISQNVSFSVSGWRLHMKTSDDSGANAVGYDLPLMVLPVPTQLVLRHEAGVDSFWINGWEEQQWPHRGDFSTWDPSYKLSLGNWPTEFEPAVRNWEGTFHLVAIYCEALTQEEIQTNCLAGPGHDLPGCDLG